MRHDTNFEGNGFDTIDTCNRDPLTLTEHELLELEVASGRPSVDELAEFQEPDQLQRCNFCGAPSSRPFCDEACEWEWEQARQA